MNIHTRLLIISTVILFSFFSCDTQKRSAPNTSDIQVNYETLALFSDIAEVDTNRIPEELAELKEKYKDFFDFYWKAIIQIDSLENYNSLELRNRFTHPDYRHLLDTVHQVFKNHSDLDADLLKLFKNIKYYDSSIKIPAQVIYINSFLQSPAFTWEDVLGIGLDMYFGENFWPYESESVRIPKYISRHNTRENIPISAARVLYSNVYPFDDEEKNLLDLMILHGKYILFLEHVLPDIDMASLFGFTEAQYKWCEENERMIYNFFSNNNLIYEKNPTKILRYIAPTPSSIGMPEESPGKTGVYIGYKIIKKYQIEKDKQLSDILNENLESQKILKLSHYKP